MKFKYLIGLEVHRQDVSKNIGLLPFEGRKTLLHHQTENSSKGTHCLLSKLKSKSISNLKKAYSAYGNQDNLKTGLPIRQAIKESKT